MDSAFTALFCSCAVPDQITVTDRAKSDSARILLCNVLFVILPGRQMAWSMKQMSVLSPPMDLRLCISSSGVYPEGTDIFPAKIRSNVMAAKCKRVQL